jgi:Putative adhesin
MLRAIARLARTIPIARTRRASSFVRGSRDAISRRQRAFNRAAPVVVVVAFAGVASAGCDVVVGGMSAAHVEREDKRFSVSGKPEVVLATFDGSIEVRPGTGSDVLVTIERRARSEAAAKEIDVAAEQSGNRVSVRVTRPHRTFGWGSSGSANLVVTVPSTADLEATSGDGSIQVRGLSGTIKSHTGDGSIKLSDVAGPVDATSGDGSITIAGKLTKLTARSGDGSVRVAAAAGSTTSSDWDVSTGDGSITLQLPSDFGAELDAHTGDGGIHVENITLASATGEIGRDTLRGRLGNGGGTLRVRTGDGSITLRR